ncbi:hypothetical protein [Lentilactobacillus hilgardii]|uniref:hypothetical protein n=1 Tax=Lentilactobacillus hilgardii TaxID=1588 RepID=UPI0021C2BF4D|nr:hypothetical protein [Lentilactobacillus hilgardii]MCP9333399.1 hypothetical protein [Lentilactobacillus hilgardii]MCP9349325.1 hypothetical protein [Lentilactobacillus hilgardii]MCP9352193.1 hypothetical protein [Lentilactobacillus hilgardii]
MKSSIIKLRKLLADVFFILFICIMILSLSPKESVRLRIAIDSHPITALKCHPKYFSKSEKYFRKPVYSIQSRYGYPSSDGSYEVYNFKVQKCVVFNFAEHII